ncbi:MAG: DEDD exonuclease domain-containing protein [Actinomycetota bacterium]
MIYGFDMLTPASDQAWQGTFDDIGTPLSQTTFIVLDLETSGASPKSGSAITEIGAVKVRGGEIIGEFQTLVNPEMGIPPFITVLTGITDAMLAPAPKIAEVFPVFLEFLGAESDAVLVAHNAPFDIGFLKAAAQLLEYKWPKYRIVDTARLARQVLLRDEVPNCKLSTLATFFRTGTKPNHRALDDAKATVDVLHGLLERVGSMDVSTLEELTGFSRRITSAQRDKKHLMRTVPSGPGLYIFRGPKNEALYIGTSRDLKSRVRSYFTAAETRKRILEMLAIAQSIDVISCATVIEAQVRELRLISEKSPPYNRRSKSQERATWITLHNSPVARFSLVRGSGSLSESKNWVGPFSGREEANLAIDAIHYCLASPEDFDPNDVRVIVEILSHRMSELSINEDFERAATVRNQLGSLLRGLSRYSRIHSLTTVSEIIAARKDSTSRNLTWEFICIRYGRFAGSARSTSGVEIKHTIESLSSTAEVVPFVDVLLPASSYEEVEKILTYLESPGIRIVSIDGEWVQPIFGAGSAH